MAVAHLKGWWWPILSQVPVLSCLDLLRSVRQIFGTPVKKHNAWKMFTPAIPASVKLKSPETSIAKSLCLLMGISQIFQGFDVFPETCVLNKSVLLKNELPFELTCRVVLTHMKHGGNEKLHLSWNYYAISKSVI